MGFDRLVLAVAQYYAVNLAYYWYHWMLHQPWSGPLYRAHYVGHHKRDYPVATLRRDRYSAKGGSGWFENGGELVFGIPVALLIAAVFWWCSHDTAASFTAVVLWVLITGEVAHSSYHLHDAPTAHPDVPVWVHRRLVRLPGYRALQKLHDIHHAKRDRNFGFCDFQMDRLFGTYCDTCPAHLEKARQQHRDAAKYAAAPTGPWIGPQTMRCLARVLVVTAATTALLGRWRQAAAELAVAASSELHWRDPRRGRLRTLDTTVVQLSLAVHLHAAWTAEAREALAGYGLAAGLFGWSLCKNSYPAHAGGWVVAICSNLLLARAR